MSGTVRLDSTWTQDFPERLATLRVGDSISGAGAWGRSARFGGIQFGTNFATQPTLVTTPLLHAAGEAIVPSTVDVFVNGRQVASEQVQPGPFTIDRLPPITGAGQMQVVVTDALGRQQVITQPYYSGRTLLRQGLNEYSFEAGSIREDYGLRSNAYGDLILAGTFRRGFTSAFTGELHAEAQAGGASAIGADAAFQVGNFGIVSVTSAAGGDEDVGFLGGVGFERNGHRFSVFLRAAYTTESFAQLGTDSLEDKPKLRSFGGAGVNLDRYGSLQLSYGEQSNWTTPSNRTIALSHSVQVGGYGYLNFIASHSTSDDSATDLFLSWTLPLGDRRTASVALSQSPDAIDGEDFEAVATFQQSLPMGSGTGYFVSLSSNEDAQLDYAVQGRAGLVGVQYARNNGMDGWRVNGSGALALTSAGVMPSRRLDQSFAVVEVADFPNMTVFVENQPIGRTDKKGRVLLDSLRAYEDNGVSVDPRELPMDATLSTAAMTVTPAYRSGPVIRFPVERSSAATFRLVLPDGTPVPAGASVTTRSEQVPVAMNGFVYLTSAAGRQDAVAEWQGHRCAFRFERPDDGDPQPDLGNVTCRAPGQDGVPPRPGTEQRSQRMQVVVGQRRHSRPGRGMVAPVVAALALLGSGEARALDCLISVTGVAFGTYDSLVTTPTDSTGNVRVRCVHVGGGAVRANYTVDLSTGGSNSYAQRQMRFGTSVLNYNLYNSATRTQVWGNGIGGSVRVSYSLLVNPRATSRRTSWITGSTDAFRRRRPWIRACTRTRFSSP